MKKSQFKIAATVTGVLVLSLLLTYFLMSLTIHSINNVSEKEALALLTENAMQMDIGKDCGSHMLFEQT